MAFNACFTSLRVVKSKKTGFSLNRLTIEIFRNIHVQLTNISQVLRNQSSNDVGSHESKQRERQRNNWIDD